MRTQPGAQRQAARAGVEFVVDGAKRQAFATRSIVAAGAISRPAVAALGQRTREPLQRHASIGGMRSRCVARIFTIICHRA